MIINVFHLLNDLSGSPKVLSQLIKGWQKKGVVVHLYTSLHQRGFLSDIPGVHYHNAWYRFSSNPWKRLLLYSISQVLLFIRLSFKLKKDDIVYVNTVLPFGAALAGKLRACKVVYHVHESTVKPPVLKWFLFKIVAKSAVYIFNVSNYVQKSHGITLPTNQLLYNAIEDDFLDRVRTSNLIHKPSNVLMVCSLKPYKGVFEYLDLATRHPLYLFRLVLNASQSEIDRFFQGRFLPENLQLYSAQTNLHPFYEWADLIVNLSRPDGWIETFGLTILEGMAYGLPAIVPPVGGILEVIEEGITGFSADSRNSDALDEAFNAIMEKNDLYQSFSNESLNRLHLFREQVMVDKSLDVLRKLKSK
jgi:glycosyltransferase involved in cell wall biosynthesis